MYPTVRGGWPQQTWTQGGGRGTSWWRVSELLKVLIRCVFQANKRIQEKGETDHPPVQQKSRQFGEQSSAVFCEQKDGKMVKSEQECWKKHTNTHSCSLGRQSGHATSSLLGVPGECQSSSSSPGEPTCRDSHGASSALLRNSKHLQVRLKILSTLNREREKKSLSLENYYFKLKIKKNVTL